MTDVANTLGWVAASLVLTSFYLRTMVPLRLVALFSNFAFIGYGLVASAIPILVLHTLLLPLNSVRLIQLLSLRRKTMTASVMPDLHEHLLPHMEVRSFPAGHQLFHCGAHVTRIFMVLQGEVRMVGTEQPVLAGQLLGDAEAFAGIKTHLQTAYCATAVQAGIITADSLRFILNGQADLSHILLRALAQKLIANALGDPHRPEGAGAESTRAWGTQVSPTCMHAQSLIRNQ